jgi:hypothetical protein
MYCTGAVLHAVTAHAQSRCSLRVIECHDAADGKLEAIGYVAAEGNSVTAPIKNAYSMVRISPWSSLH